MIIVISKHLFQVVLDQLDIVGIKKTKFNAKMLLNFMRMTLDRIKSRLTSVTATMIN